MLTKNTPNSMCKTCGVSFRRTPSQIKTGRKLYCSKSCSIQGQYGRRTFDNMLCQQCGKSFRAKPYRIGSVKYCSMKCYRKARKGTPLRRIEGVTVEICHRGYRHIWLPQHPSCDSEGYVSEHRLVAAAMLGRMLNDREIVHHKDGNRLNNDPSNLQVMSQSAHMKLHRNQERELRDKAA